MKEIDQRADQRGLLTGPPFCKNPETAQNDRKSANRGLENWNRPEVSIRGADQKDRGLWERECVQTGVNLVPRVLRPGAEMASGLEIGPELEGHRELRRLVIVI